MLLSGIRQRVINWYQHIMACRVARAWLLIVVVHFIVQISLQAVTLRENQQAKDTTRLCLTLSQVPLGVPLLEGDNLSLCDGIPGSSSANCTLLVASAENSTLFPTLHDMDMNVLLGFDFGLDKTINITVSGNEHLITGRCAMSLEWIFVAFRNNVAEDIATICFQFWLLIVSLLVVLQDSIPHLVVCIASHLLDVGWAGFRIKSTIALREDYYEFIVGDACGGEDMLGHWWEQRLAHAAPLFGTNVIILILLSVLAGVMFEKYAKINFCHMGASPSINRLYKFALSFSAFLQLAGFFTILAVGMWIDLLSCDVIAALDRNVRSDVAAFLVLAVIIAPWIICGWWAIFREVKWAFILFGVFHAFLLALWPSMFSSAIFRYVFKTWSFFACVSVVSYVFVVATAIMAVICRLYFGRGLGHFLRVEADLSSSGFPGTFFANDPAHGRSDSPTPSDFDFLDTEKARKEFQDDGPMDIRPYNLESTKYSTHAVSFKVSTDSSDTPSTVALPTTRSTRTAIIQAMNKGNDRARPTVKVNSESRPVSRASHTNSTSPKQVTPTSGKEKPVIQPPPEAYLQCPHKETRSRKETPSLLTQATGVSTNSCSQVVVTVARKDPVVSAPARTIAISPMPPTRTPSPVDTVMPHEDCPSIDLGTRSRFSPQPGTHGRI